MNDRRGYLLTAQDSSRIGSKGYEQNTQAAANYGRADSDLGTIFGEDKPDDYDHSTASYAQCTSLNTTDQATMLHDASTSHDKVQSTTTTQAAKSSLSLSDTNPDSLIFQYGYQLLSELDYGLASALSLSSGQDDHRHHPKDEAQPSYTQACEEALGYQDDQGDKEEQEAVDWTQFINPISAAEQLSGQPYPFDYADHHQFPDEQGDQKLRDALQYDPLSSNDISNKHPTRIDAELLQGSVHDLNYRPEPLKPWIQHSITDYQHTSDLNSSFQHDLSQSSISSSARQHQPKRRIKHGLHNEQHDDLGARLNKRPRRTVHNDVLKHAPSVQIALPTIDIGAYELLCYFPNHTQWPAALIRLTCNEWHTNQVAEAQMFARGILDVELHNCRKAAMRHQVCKAGQQFFGIDNFQRTTHSHLIYPRDMINPTGWVPRTNVQDSLRRSGMTLEDATLVSLANRVVHHPEDFDRGILTQAIELAVVLEMTTWKVSDLSRIALEYNLVMPEQASDCIGWDIASLQRFVARLDAAGGVR